MASLDQIPRWLERAIYQELLKRTLMTIVNKEDATRPDDVEQYDITEGKVIRKESTAPDSQETRIAELWKQRIALLTYVQSKVQANDWHAVADAAMDLREVEARLSMINARHKE